MSLFLAIPFLLLLVAIIIHVHRLSPSPTARPRASSRRPRRRRRSSRHNRNPPPTSFPSPVSFPLVLVKFHTVSHVPPEPRFNLVGQSFAQFETSDEALTDLVVGTCWDLS